jgi:phosphohistidine phosphatase
MRLFLVRHARAGSGVPDELRSLTPDGREQARRLGERLAGKGVRPDAVVTSPLLRARETGDMLAQALDAVSEPDERLAPGATTEAVRSAIAGRGAVVLVVGHQPDLGRAAAELSGGPEPDLAPCDLVELDLPS